MFKKITILLYALAMTALVAFDPFGVVAQPFSSDGQRLKVELSRSAFTVLAFPSKQPTTSAIILFGSGDGGWSDLEEAIAHSFQKEGCEVIGLDCNAYAKTDYDLQVLQTDYGKIARTVIAPFGPQPPPLVVGGYSMGAAQAIAVAGGPSPPPGLVGLLLIDPLSRGRYGLHASDQMDILPTGPGTFGVNEFSDKMASLRVVQWHAENDLIDSQSWLDTLTAQYKLFTFPRASHSYAVDREDFLRQLVQSAQWIIEPPTNRAMTSPTTPKP